MFNIKLSKVAIVVLSSFVLSATQAYAQDNSYDNTNTNSTNTSTMNPSNPNNTTTTTTTNNNHNNTEMKHMQPPKPIKNKVFDAMVGSWSGESDMMGTKMQDTLEIRWALNHQFLIFDLKSQSKDNAEQVYEGKGIFGIDKSGHAKTWWFDNWGAQAVSTGTGKFVNDKKLEITDGNSMFKETRTFEIDPVNSNQMLMTAKGSMTIDGKKKTFDQKTTYTK